MGLKEIGELISFDPNWTMGMEFPDYVYVWIVATVCVPVVVTIFTMGIVTVTRKNQAKPLQQVRWDEPSQADAGSEAYQQHSIVISEAVDRIGWLWEQIVGERESAIEKMIVLLGDRYTNAMVNADRRLLQLQGEERTFLAKQIEAFGDAELVAREALQAAKQEESRDLIQTKINLTRLLGLWRKAANKYEDATNLLAQLEKQLV